MIFRSFSVLKCVGLVKCCVELSVSDYRYTFDFPLLLLNVDVAVVVGISETCVGLLVFV